MHLSPSRRSTSRCPMRSALQRLSVIAPMALAVAAASVLAAPKLGDPPEARDMALLGFHDLQARSAYQPVVKEQNGRWILYVGHHGGTERVPKPLNSLTGNAEFNGTSVLDVTDPHAPRLLSHIPGEEGLGENGGAQMVRVCSGADLPKGDRSKF